MIVANKNFEIVTPKNQLQLYGYKYYFDTFANLFKNNKLPNTILLSGLKRSGKATFAYHFINYLLSYNEQNKYLVKNFTINPDNKTYKSVCDLIIVSYMHLLMEILFVHIAIVETNLYSL